MGHFSVWGITFVVEIVTGRLIDFKLTEKCTKCKKCDNFEDNGNCIYGKFHGCSGSMECYNAEVLFKRSANLGFRYSEYVSDGDSKVFSHLVGLGIYPDVDLKKIECATHMSKRGSAALHNLGHA